MFRGVYVRLLLLMSVTLLVLLSVVGAMTYVVFGRRLMSDGQADLVNQANEIIHAVSLLDRASDGHRGQHLHRLGPHSAALDDDYAENVSFIVRDETGRIILQSVNRPLASKYLTFAPRHPGFRTVIHAQTAFRVYTTSYDVEGHRGRLWVFHSLSKEEHTLGDISAILWITGAIGGMMVVLLNLWLASRALAPARRTWQTQQDMLLELSHELKTPLATITAIASSSTSPDASRLIYEAQHANSLLEDILYFARLQSTMGQRVEPIAVSDVTEDTVNRFVPLARADHMTIQGRAQDGLFVLTTFERWSHLVSILFKNATQHGRSHTDIRWSLEEVGPGVVFKIDNEKGDTKPPTTAASGIGLRIAERLVRDMHGQLQFETQRGRVITRVIVPKCSR